MLLQSVVPYTASDRESTRESAGYLRTTDLAWLFVSVAATIGHGQALALHRTAHSSRPWLAQEQHYGHTGETQERNQHEAILIGRNGGLLFQMLLHQHLDLCFPQLPDRTGLVHQLAHRGENFSPAQR